MDTSFSSFYIKHNISINTYLSGYILRPLSIPGQYDKNAANAVSNTKPKFKAQFRIP